MSDAPKVWLAAEREVILVGQVPVVDVYAGTLGGEYRNTRDFELRASAGSVTRACDSSLAPAGSRGLATLNFECLRPGSPGLYRIALNPVRLGVAGEAVELPLRVLSEIPEPAPGPERWVAIPLAAGIPEECHSWGPWYHVQSDAGKISFAERPHVGTAPIPKDLSSRMSPDHAHAVRYVFEDHDGWLVMFDHGEFGDGVEWYPKAGGTPRSIRIGLTAGELVPQNVNRAMAAGGVVFVLQGLSHLGMSSGHLAAIWLSVVAKFEGRVVALFDGQNGRSRRG